jgi:hypothetical protein
MGRTKIDRKEFLKSALVLAGVGAGVASLATCGGDSGKGGGTGGNGGGTGGTSGGNACDTNEPMEVIASNHGHALTVTAADVAAGANKTYSIQGTSGHDHSITVTAAMFTMLKAGTPIMTVSTSGGGHTHSVSVACG